MAKIITVSQTPTITAASAYVAGNALGGLLTFSACLGYGHGILLGISIIDKANQKAATDLLLFNSSITATADKSALAISLGDMAKYLGHISVVAGDYATTGTGAGATKGNMWLGMVPDSTTSGALSLFGQLVTRGTPTYASTSDITVKLFIEVDNLA